MPEFGKLTSLVLPLPVDNIDTDQIIPARFLKTIDKAGLGTVLFCDWRYVDSVPNLESAAHASPRPDFPLNDPRYAGAKILLAGDNFGCGSSREHAPWALKAWGFQAIIATSFADIFRANSLKNGLLPVEVSPEVRGDLMETAHQPEGLSLTIDLESQTVRLPDHRTAEFPIDEFAKNCLLRGIDELGYLLSFCEQITEFEESRGA
jgi:3-isopropylmalate/(R)-2-methylmalate dehydratase small subunit